MLEGGDSQQKEIGGQLCAHRVGRQLLEGQAQPLGRHLRQLGVVREARIAAGRHARAHALVRAPRLGAQHAPQLALHRDLRARPQPKLARRLVVLP